MAPATRVTPEAIAALLAERMQLAVDGLLANKLTSYLELLLRWNARTNLSAIRTPEEIVLRHFGESLQCAAAIPPNVRTLLDYGSGGGFPGAICALARPELQVTLAESQGKKAAFLQELCRVLPLQAKVHAGRVVELPSPLAFDAVTLRAVENMPMSVREARTRVAPGGWLVLMTTVVGFSSLKEQVPLLRWLPLKAILGSEQAVLAVGGVEPQ